MYSVPTARGRYAVPKWGWGGGVGAGGDMIKEGVLREISIHGRYFVVWRVGRWNNYDRIMELGAHRMFFQNC